MVNDRKWFQKAVYGKAPYNLHGWHKGLSPEERRARALSSRPRSWTLKKRYLSVSRALQALANVTKDRQTSIVAKSDADYFLRKYYGGEIMHYSQVQQHKKQEKQEWGY